MLMIHQHWQACQKYNRCKSIFRKKRAENAILNTMTILLRGFVHLCVLELLTANDWSERKILVKFVHES
jgi:hypothetical protein